MQPCFLTSSRSHLIFKEIQVRDEMKKYTVSLERGALSEGAQGVFTD